MRDEFRGIPPGEVVAPGKGEVGPQDEQLSHGAAGRLEFPELPVSRGEHDVRIVEVRQVDLERDAERRGEVALAICVVEERKPVPSGMARIELAGPLHHRAAPLPVARIRHQSTHQGKRTAVHRVECERLLRRSPEGLELLAEEPHLRQRDVCKGIRRRGIGRTPRRLESAAEGIGLEVEPIGVLFGTNDREHGPSVGIARRELDAALQVRPRPGMFFRGATLVVSKAAQHRLVRADLVGLFVPESFAHAVRQTPYQSATVETIRGTRSSCRVNTSSAPKGRS